METLRSIDCIQCQPRQKSIFCDLTHPELQYIKDHKVTKVYKKKDMVFHEGDKPQGLFCVFSGLIKIYKSSSDGKDQIVRLAKGGDVLGYRSFFSGEPYAGSAQAIEDSTICFIDREGMEKLIQKSPALVYSFLKRVCSELRTAEEKFQDLLEKTVEERVAHLLSLLVEKNNSHLKLPLSREEIASLVGARPETVIRVFSSWKEKGFGKNLEFR